MIENAKIYKIICLTTGKIYIGSTILTLKQRLSQHKSGAKTKNPNSKEITDNNNYVILLIKAIKFCETRFQMLCWERYYIEKYVCINKQIPTRTGAEWYQDNKEKIKEQNVIYCQNNKDKIKEMKAIYYQNNKKKINKRNTIYRQNNKDKSAIRYQNNKDKYNEKSREKVTCECGSVITKKYLAAHQKTLKHIRMLAQLLS